jgi:histidyl-tRNA synthetase
MKFQSVKGTRDFYPEDMAVRNWIVNAWRQVSARHGFEEYDGPIFEYLDLFKAKSGEGIVSELFHFEDRGGRELAIRPEMTPTLGRMIAARAQSLPRPIKWFAVSRLCRAERPQRGRLREFFQWNIDVIGEDDVIADAECIFVMLDFLRHVGLTPSEAVLKINSRALLSALLEARGFTPDRHESIYGVLDKRDKLPDEEYHVLLDKVAQSDREKVDLLALVQAQGPEGLQNVANLAAGNAAAESQVERIERLWTILNALGVADYCMFDMSIVRGLAYYTGIVFEGFGRAGLQRAICGGGRYDQLVELLGGPPMSGVGFGTSDVVLLDLLCDTGRLPAEARVSRRVDFFVIDADRERFDAVLDVVAQLRSGGHSAQFSYKRVGVGKQFKQAANLGAGRVVIVGRELAEHGVVGVKNMATGEQLDVPLASFLANPCAH